MRRIPFLLALLCLLIPAFAAQAQAPDAINSALNDLSQRLGHTIGINDLDNWTFEQKVFPTPALGCPQPGVMYAQVQTVGVQFILTYNGTAYDYRVSGDKTIVVLCNSAAATDVPAPCPPPGDRAYLAPRLSIGLQAQVVVGGFPNNIRDLPGTSGKYLGEIPPGQTFTVLDGPRCSLIDKLVWWQVNYNNIIGWTAEGKDGEYWVTPLNLAGTPQAVPLKETITAVNAAQVALLPGSTGSGIVAVSPDGDKLAQASQNGVQLSFVGITQSPLIFTLGTTQAAPTALAFDSTGKWLLVGFADGSIALVDASSNTALTLRLQLTGHTGAVNGVAFSPDGKLIVSGGDDTTIRLWDASTGAALAVLKGQPNPVATVAFSADGSTLITRDKTGLVNVWRALAGGAAG